METIQDQKTLLVCLMISGFVIIIANIIHKEIAIVAGNLLYVPISGFLLFISTKMVLRFREHGDHGKAWILFLGFSLSWFVGEMTWSIFELILNIEPFPSTADIFYLLGYPLLFSFTIYYLKPVNKKINQKLIVSSILISLSIIISTVFVTIPKFEQSSDDFLSFAISIAYPIFDSLVLIPAIIGVALFFRGKVNFMWSLVLIGILIVNAADTLFLLTQLEDSYYTGHPIEILFYWAYLFFVFGIYHHYRIFPSTSKKNNFRTTV